MSSKFRKTDLPKFRKIFFSNFGKKSGSFFKFFSEKIIYKNSENKLSVVVICFPYYTILKIFFRKWFSEILKKQMNCPLVCLFCSVCSLCLVFFTRFAQLFGRENQMARFLTSFWSGNSNI